MRHAGSFDFTMKRFTRSLMAATFAFAAFGPLTAVASAQTVIYVPIAPPEALTETMPPAPGPDQTWIPGYYRFDEPTQAYVWIPGHFVATPKAGGTVWVPGHWDKGTTGYYWVPGHWRSS